MKLKEQYKILTENFRYISDKIRYDYLSKIVLSPITDEQPDVKKLKDIWDGYDDLIVAFNRGNYIDYYEGFVPSCWKAFEQKEEYKNMKRDEIIDSFLKNRFSKIVHKLKYKKYTSTFINNILYCKIDKYE